MDPERISPPRRVRGPLALIPLLTLSGFLLLDRSAFRPPPHGEKPMFPVAVALELADVPPAGGAARVLASVTAWAPGETVEWRLDLPEGVARLEGPLAWSGTLAAGETRHFEIRLQLPDDRPHELYALGRLPERPRATAGASLTLDAGASDAAPATLEAGVGQDYLQYRGEVQPRAAEAPRGPGPEPRR